MTIKELKEALANLPAGMDDAEVLTTDYNENKLVRAIGDVCTLPDNKWVSLRIWLTDKERFEEERKRSEIERAYAETIMNVKTKKRK